MAMGNLDAVKKLLPQTTEQDGEMLQAMGDPEVKEMLEEAPLLDLIRADTGEDGHCREDRIDFGTCPVCGHEDCFRYYPESNSWSCFSESNATGYNGGTYLEYLKAVHGYDDRNAMESLREVTGHPRPPIEHKPRTRAEKTAELPPWRNVRASDPPERNPILIPGILRKGHVAVLAGKGKIGKTQIAIQLAIAVVTNGEWLGHRIENGGKVLYIDPECDAKSLDNRFSYMCEALGVDKGRIDDAIYQWPLRGIGSYSIENLTEYIQEHSAHDEFALVIVDSASIFVKGDENSSGDVRRFGNEVIRLAEITGASVLCVHHFGKATDGGRLAADRARGSSVWLDFPDAQLTLTEITPSSGDPSEVLSSGEYGVLLEASGLREFPRMDPVHLIFNGLTYRRDDDEVTQGWTVSSSQKKGGQITGAKNADRAASKWTEAERDLLAEFMRRGIGSGGMLMSEASEICDMRRDHLAEKIKERSLYFEIKKSGRENWIYFKDPPPNANEATDPPNML